MYDTVSRRRSLLYPWCELAETFLPHNPAEAERIMREALAVTK